MSALCPSTIVAGKYRLARMLGEGGMGQVWLAENVILRKEVALKVIHEQGATDRAMVERFLREAITASRVTHPAIVEIHDAGIDEGIAWIAMERLEGESLASRIARRPLSLDDVRALLLPIVDALAALHDVGIVHRDLKPDNIFLEQLPTGAIQPKLLDFGIAKQLAAVSPLTKTGELIGTGHYLSPEQARGARDLDARSDLYSMGVVLFESLSGRTPFEAETLPELIAKLFTEPPRSLRQLAPAVPESVASVVHRCLSREPMARPHDARALHRMLRDALETPARTLPKTVVEREAPPRNLPRQPPPEWPPSPPRPPVSLAGRRRSHEMGLAILVLGIGIALALGIIGWARTTSPARRPAVVAVAAPPHASAPPAAAVSASRRVRRAQPTAPPASSAPSACEAATGPIGRSDVRTGSIEVRGPLSREDVRRVVRTRLSDVTICHEAALTLCASVTGRIELNVAITSSGQVEAVTPGPSTLHDGGHVEGCVMRAMRDWHFPTRSVATTVALAYVLDVEPVTAVVPAAHYASAAASDTSATCTRGSISVLAPFGAQVSIDGHARREAAFGGEAWVCAGPHRVRVVDVDGRVLLSERVSVPEGIRVELDAAPRI